MPTVRERFASAWNAFTGKNEKYDWQKVGRSSYIRPDRHRIIYGGERTIISSIYNRIAIDVAANDIMHVKVDDNGNYEENISSRLNYALTVEANLDQTGRALIQDIVISMCDEGVVALVPVEATDDVFTTTSYDVINIRCCRITEWHAQTITVDIYNEISGLHETVTLPKKVCCILENPLYSVMNEPNSTLQRLIRKLALLDAIDDNNSGNKLDLIIQLPYVIKSEAKREQANERIKEIERQMQSSKYGIAYTDGTEKVVQLNRAIENNIFSQIQYYTELLYSQLGMSKAVLDGTANEQEMLNYQSRTVEPFLNTIVEEIKRKWLSKTAITQGQSVKFFRNPFKLIPVEKVADISDKMTRNAILSSNEVRAIVGYKPSHDPRADELSNKNLNQSTEEMQLHQGMNVDPNEEIEEPSKSELVEPTQEEIDEEALREFIERMANRNAR